MKRKLPLNQEIYLPDYFSDIVARTFEKESEQRILYWDFRKSFDEKVKMQIDIAEATPLKFFKDCEKNITDIGYNSVEGFSKRLSMQHIFAKSYNNKLRDISSFLHYLKLTECIDEFSNPIPLYYKKNYPVVNEIDNLEQKLGLC